MDNPNQPDANNALVSELFTKYSEFVNAGETHTMAWRKSGLFEQPQEVQLSVTHLLKKMGIIE